MKAKIAFAAALLAIAISGPARAQVMVDMSRVTCKQFLDGADERQSLLASWMMGYFSASKNRDVIDVTKATRNINAIARYCQTHKSATLMNAVRKTAK